MLQSVEYGCVLVTFLVTAAVERRLFLDGIILTAEQDQETILKKVHVTY